MKQYITNVSDPAAFAKNIHAHGYGSENTKYVSDFLDVFGLILAREKCLQ